MVLEALKRINMRVFLFTALAFGVLGTANAQTRFAKEVAEIQKRSVDKNLENPVIFVGSSSIRMWESLESDYSEVSALNHGFGGSEYSDVILYQKELITSFNPSRVVFYAGDNDIANGEAPGEVAIEAISLVSELLVQNPKLSIIILSVKPSIARWQLKKEYEDLNGLLENFASGKKNVVFVDVWSPMLKSNGQLNKGLFIEDGLHMNEAGYSVWKKVLTPYLSSQ